MAEAVGLAASFVALAGLAHTVLKFVPETRRIVRSARKLDKETDRSIDQIYFAAGTIKVVQSTLSRYCESTSASRSQVIRFIEDEEAAAFLKSESEYLRDHIKKLKRGVDALRQRWVLVAAVIWHYFIKEQIDDLWGDMERIRSNLELLLFAYQLETALEREVRHEAEIKYYKRLLKHKEKQIKRLSRNGVNVTAGADSFDQEHSTSSPLQHHQQIKAELHVFLKLSKTLRKTETVPHSSRMSPNTSPSPSPSTLTASTRRTSEAGTYTGEQPITRRDESPVSPRLPSMPYPFQDIPGRPGASEVSSTTGSPARNSPESPTSSVVSRAVLGAGLSQGPAPPRSPSIRSEDGLIGVYSGEATGNLTSSEEQIEQGHIRYGGGEKMPVVGQVKPEQDFNFMTTFYASELGLLDFIQPCEDGDGEIWIMPSGEKIRPHGTIELRWYPHQSRSMPLKFFVLSRWREKDIILGAPFVAKKQHYAKRGREIKE